MPSPANAASRITSAASAFCLCLSPALAAPLRRTWTVSSGGAATPISAIDTPLNNRLTAPETFFGNTGDSPRLDFVTVPDAQAPHSDLPPVDTQVLPILANNPVRDTETSPPVSLGITIPVSGSNNAPEVTGQEASASLNWQQQGLEAIRQPLYPAPLFGASHQTWVGLSGFWDGTKFVAPNPTAVQEVLNPYLFSFSGSDVRGNPTGYRRGIFAEAVNPLSGMVATGGFDGGVQLWLLNGKHVRSWGLGNSADIRAIAFDPKGSMLAIGAPSGGVHIIPVLENEKSIRAKILRVAPGGNSPVHAVAFSLDGRLVAGGDASGMVRVWDVSTDRLVREFPHKHSVVTLIFSPDGQSLATVDRFGGVHLWDIYLSIPHPMNLGASYKQDFQIPADTYSDARYGIAFGRKNLAISSPGGSAIGIWDLPTMKIVRTLTNLMDPDWISQLVLSGDGRLLASADVGGNVRVWDIPSGKLLISHRFKDSVLALHFKPKTHVLIVCDRDGTITQLRAP